MTHSYDKTQTLPVATSGRVRVADAAAGFARPKSDALRPGHPVGDWRIEQVLGLGHADILYLAQDAVLGKTVLLQEFFPAAYSSRQADGSVLIRSPDDLVPFEEGLKQITAEAEKLAALQQDSITRTLRQERRHGSVYVAVQHEDGDALDRWRLRQPPLDRPTLLKTVWPVLEALAALHSADLLHQGIAPETVRMRAGGSPCLVTLPSSHRGACGPSSGFTAPEQCGSDQATGPWTDIYGLGALMYWLATGNEPTDAAARLQGDVLPRAVQAGNRLVYGEPLLRAIDQCLDLDTSRRPQNVGELLQALEATDLSRTQSMSALQPSGNASTPQAATQERSRGAPGDKSRYRSVLGTLLALGIVNDGKADAGRQVALQALLQDCADACTQTLKNSSHLRMNTPDGMIMCFVEDPEDALESALRLRELLQRGGHALALRIGLHLGPIRLQTGDDGKTLVLGDGANVAQRITDFARPNQIVMTRALHDLIGSLSDNAQGLFRELGVHMDKHLRSHHIYEVLDPRHRPAAAPVTLTGFERTASFAALASLTPEVVGTIEAELTAAIGPLASALVKKALLRSWTADGLREVLSAAIPDALAKQKFARARRTAAL
ncbi:hypothetical protein [Polaromonas sp. YR568]|uniref:serine/threonine protein kinase n=1 Tax=Polaromonas sp. YR568 TaxID=1855301 RepID=UPI003137B7A1